MTFNGAGLSRVAQIWCKIEKIDGGCYSNTLSFFAHSLVNSKSRRLIQVLEEQSAGFIARHQEQDLNTGARTARSTISVNTAQTA